MLIKSSSLLNLPILSVHMGGKIAEVSEVIINPDNLKVEAFRLIGPEVGGENGDILQTKDIREFSMGLGAIVDSADEFVNDADVIKLQKILEIDFKLIDKSVETKKGSKLGKVSSYMVNSDDFMVQQLIVRRPLLKSFIDPELVIGRSEVVKVTDDKIIVKDEESKIRKKAMTEDFVPNFVNPFREPNLSTADTKNLDE